jgi:hypothetical protein
MAQELRLGRTAVSIADGPKRVQRAALASASRWLGGRGTALERGFTAIGFLGANSPGLIEGDGHGGIISNAEGRAKRHRARQAGPGGAVRAAGLSGPPGG